ncbi:MAG TPA: urease accessory protein UreE [Fontimonas sp.]
MSTLLRVTERLPSPVASACREIVLSYAERSRSRLRAVLEDGAEVGLFLPRGTQLRDGDGLLAENGDVIRVRAAIEPLYRVTAAADACDPAFALLRAAYHLGNRHIPLALSPTALLLEPDPVLRDMLLGLGMVVGECATAFEPEPGAYGGGHRHDHDEHAGSVGELLSQQAHARPLDMTTLQFHR